MAFNKEIAEENFRVSKIDKFLKIKPKLNSNVVELEKYRRFKYSQKSKFSNLESEKEIFEELF